MDNPTKLYDRWDVHQRIQHWIMMVSFSLLAVTGLLIKFAHSSFAQGLAKIFGSFEIMFTIHLVAAILMSVSALYHLGYLVLKASQRRLRFTMLPKLQDAKDIVASFRLYLGLSKSGPRFAKYSYKEKVDYLAEYWGTPVMILSGLMIWFPGAAAAIFPNWVINSAHFVHQGEGLLAILVIFIWHLYSVHFTPEFFPMNSVWLDGKISREVMAREYPLELAHLEQEEAKIDER